MRMNTSCSIGNEASRLAALYALNILDTPPEERFDRIVRHAASTFDVPIAMISLVDQDRQWFKARVGVDVVQTDRCVSVCSHAIRSRGVFEVEDLRADQRFATNPLVIDSPYIRSYTGAPLLLPCGEAAGALCLIDFKPRRFDRLELLVLEALRNLTVEELMKTCEQAPAGP